MSKVFVTADTHFGHKKIIDFESKHRPFATIEDHDEAIVDNWNKTVGKNDTVIHLGDVLFGAGSFVHLARLNGNKRLVLGNHDTYPLARYLQYFTKVHAYIEYKGCILTHIPIQRACLIERWRYNIHGHTHSDIVRLHEVEDIWYKCVSMEHTNLRPIPIEDVL